MRELLKDLEVAILKCNDSHSAEIIRNALADSGDSLELFLKSNELWGGSGSIADQAGIQDARTDTRREVEKALIALGQRQIEKNIINERTRMWVEKFIDWSKNGI